MFKQKRELFPNKDTEYDTHIHREVYEIIQYLEGPFTSKDVYDLARRKHGHLTRDRIRRAIANICGVYHLGLKRVQRGVYEWDRS